MLNSSVTVLSYHRIAHAGNPDLSDSLIDAYPGDFEAQMRYLAAHYTVLSSWDLVRALGGGYTLPRQGVIITFDDGYRCFLDTAMPVMRRLGLPVTLFVCSHVAGNEGALFWWDELYRSLMRARPAEIEAPGLGVLPLGSADARQTAFARLVPYMERVSRQSAAGMLQSIVAQCDVAPNTTRYLLNWDELRALEAEGVAIGPHTRHHPILAQATPASVRNETYGSWYDLCKQLSRPLPIFCYPNGRAHAVNSLAVNAVKQAGLVGAFTTVTGLNRLNNTNPYRMHRIGSTAGESIRHFAIKISPVGRAYRRLKMIVKRKGIDA